MVFPTEKEEEPKKVSCLFWVVGNSHNTRRFGFWKRRWSGSSKVFFLVFFSIVSLGFHGWGSGLKANGLLWFSRHF